jgi:membrane-bound lytic murein transglycosylase B
MKKGLMTAMLLVFLLSFRVRDYAMAPDMETMPVPPHDYTMLFDYLAEHNYNMTEVQQLFQDPRVAYYPDIAVKLSNPPTMDSYSSVFFHTENESYEIEDFLQQYQSQLDTAEQRFGVAKEAIVAVLFVETKLGKIVGKYSVFNVLSSLANADSPESQARIENYINEHYHYLSFDKRQNLIDLYQKRAMRKAIWARIEFGALLKLHDESHLDILELPGSYAGAFGYPQFMPSNVVRYGIDGDHDGKIDLYNYTDAIMSVGNFLSRKGWTADTQRQQRALFRYNNSRAYVADVLETASLIREDFMVD